MRHPEMATSRPAPATRGIGDAREFLGRGRVRTRDRRRDPSPGAASRQWPAGVFETCRWTCRRSFSTLRPLDGPDGRPVAEWDHKGRRLAPRAGARGRPSVGKLDLSVSQLAPRAGARGRPGTGRSRSTPGALAPRAGARGRPRPPRDGEPPDAQAGAQQQFPGTDLQRRREAHCRRGRRRTAGRGRENVARAARWDGPLGVIANLRDMPAAEVLTRYHGLWRVEESFRTARHDLRVRPIWHGTPDRIRGQKESSTGDDASRRATTGFLRTCCQT